LDVAREKGASHFVLLSAICVQKPLLEFQRAKLKLEADLQVGGCLGGGLCVSSWRYSAKPECRVLTEEGLQQTAWHQKQLGVAVCVLTD
jgi:hypothetical protein